MLENNMGSKRRRKTKQKHNMCVGHHYMQTNTYNVNETWALLQTTGGKDESSISIIRGYGSNFWNECEVSR